MARGKYEGLKGVLPKGNPVSDELSPEAIGKFEMKVREERAKLTGLPFEELVAAYVAARDEKEALEELLSECNAKVEALTRATIDGLEETGLTSVTLVTGEAVDSSVEPYAQVTDRDAVRNWAKESGYENSLQLPWSTLNAIVKERLLSGEPEPPGVTAFLRTKLRLRRK